MAKFSFKATFSAIKASITKSVVDSKLNDVERKLKEGKVPTMKMFRNIFEYYQNLINMSYDIVTESVTENKDEVSQLLVENYEPIMDIINAVKRLNNERNRGLLKDILDNTNAIVNSYQDEYDRMEETVTTKVTFHEDELKDIWEIKSKTKE